MKKIFIVMAAYNEETSIGGVLESLMRGGYEHIVVVDDGSTDKTSDIASRYPISVIRHQLNRGQGAALKTGIDFALSHNADVIVTYDADGQHQVKDIRSLVGPVIDGETDVTLGSRFLRASRSSVPILRKIYLKIGAMAILLLYGVRLTDSHNGLRAFSRKAARKIEIKCDRMDHASEIIDQIKKKSLRYKEVPVVIRYTEYSVKHGQNYITNAFNIFFRMLFKKLVG